MSLDEALGELGQIDCSESGPQIPIYILSRESRGDGSGNWTDYDRPSISVFSDIEKLAANLMKEENLGRLAAKRIIKLGGLQQGENNWLRIYQDVLNPTPGAVDKADFSEGWSLPGVGFMGDLDMKGAEDVALEFMYLQGLAPTGLQSRCKKRCNHPWWEYRDKKRSYSYDDRKTPYVTCSENCGLTFNVRTLQADLPKWSKYRQQYSCYNYEQIQEERVRDAQRHWKFRELTAPLYAIEQSSFVTILKKAPSQPESKYLFSSEKHVPDKYVVVGKLCLDAKEVLTAVLLEDKDKEQVTAMGLHSSSPTDVEFGEHKIILPLSPPGAVPYTFVHKWNVKIELGKPIPKEQPNPFRMPRWN